MIFWRPLPVFALPGRPPSFGPGTHWPFLLTLEEATAWFNKGKNWSAAASTIVIEEDPPDSRYRLTPSIGTPTNEPVVPHSPVPATARHLVCASGVFTVAPVYSSPTTYNTGPVVYDTCIKWRWVLAESYWDKAAGVYFPRIEFTGASESIQGDFALLAADHNPGLPTGSLTIMGKTTPLFSSWVPGWGEAYVTQYVYDFVFQPSEMWFP